MTDRKELLCRLDELAATAKTLDDEGLEAVVAYMLGAVTAVAPEPMPDEYDLRAVDGSLWRLRKRDGESEDDYAERRRIRDEQAASLRTYPLDWSDFEQISPPTPEPEPMPDEVADAVEREVGGDD